MKKIWSAIALAIGLIVLAADPTAWAQNTNSGDIRGVITDSTGAIIPGATVNVTNIDNGISKDFVANGDGLYDTGPILLGQYKITVSKEGFANYERTGVNLQVGTITINAQLGAGAITQTVNVDTDVPLIKTETGEQSTTLEAKEMQQRANVGQDWENFIKLLPGTTGTTSYGASGQALSSNGNLPYNSVLADGASSALSHSGNADVAIFETVQEVQVATSSFSAQYGIGGVVMNQITKGGTNQWHGSLYEYFQNDALNAKNYFANSVPYLRYHNFGGSVSGPIIKNKMFFFFDADKIINKSASIGYITVPTAAMRAGDFSALAPIYNPAGATYVTGTDGKQYINRPRITGNIITNARPLDPVALKLQQYIPLPNSTVQARTSATTGITTNNYYYNQRSFSNFMKYFGRLDYQITPNNRLTASVTQHDNPGYSPNQGLCPFNCQFSDVDGYNSQITDVWNISSRTINEARLGYTNQLNFFVPDGEGAGIPAAAGLAFSKADIPPQANISGGYYTLQPATAATYKEHNYDPSDVVTMIRGQHVLHFGGEYQIFQDNSTAWGNQTSANLTFDGSFSQCTYCQRPEGGGLAATGNGYADFLMGAVQSWSATNRPSFYGRTSAPQMFVQDDWKLRPNLTINLGLRYQMQIGWRDKQGNQRTFDPMVTNSATNTSGGMWYALNKDHGRTQLQDNNYTTFLPRFGMAWQLSPGTVLRAGYGLYAYMWSLDTYGSGEGDAFGASGSVSDTTGGLTPIGSLSGPANQFDSKYVITTAQSAFLSGAYNGQGVSYNQQHTPVAKIHQYNVTIEKQIGANMATTIAYVGSRGLNLNFNVDINQVPVANLAPNDQAFRPYSQFQNITGSTNNSDSNYNSLQVTFQRRLSQGLAVNASYTWSKFLNEFDSSAWGSRGGAQPYQLARNVGANYGPSNFDVRNALRGNINYDLPFGKGRMFLNKNWLLDEAIGGWRLSTNFVLQSGQPFTVTVNGANNSYLQSGSWYANQIGDPQAVQKRSINQWFNTAAFVSPAPGTIGNVHRDNVYGPGFASVDASLGKTFALWKDQYKLQIRADANNVMNHPAFSNPNGQVGNSSFGQITTTQPYVGPRSMQLGARFSF